MTLWQTHKGFEVEFDKLRKKVRAVDASFAAAKKLLSIQFNPTNPLQVISPGKLHRLHSENTWTLWKLEMVTKGLKSNQFPRIWFAVSGETITLLAIGTHMQNYDDNERERCALERLSEIN